MVVDDPRGGTGESEIEVMDENTPGPALPPLPEGEHALYREGSPARVKYEKWLYSKGSCIASIQKDLAELLDTKQIYNISCGNVIEHQWLYTEEQMRSYALAAVEAREADTKLAYYVDGPKGSASYVLKLEDVEATIKFLAERHGFDVDDYTATPVLLTVGVAIAAAGSKAK